MTFWPAVEHIVLLQHGHKSKSQSSIRQSDGVKSFAKPTLWALTPFRLSNSTYGIDCTPNIQKPISCEFCTHNGNCTIACVRAAIVRFMCAREFCALTVNSCLTKRYFVVARSIYRLTHKCSICIHISDRFSQLLACLLALAKWRRPK